MPDALHLLRAPGWTIARPGTAGWITDFLNAAYYARRPADRDVDDLRLAFAILTTRWARVGRRLDVRDAAVVLAAFSPARLSPARGGVARFDRDGLLAGARRLHGGWFADAWEDPARRAHGVVFETREERLAFDPARRLAAARPGPLTPPARDAAERLVHTYPPVALPDAGAALALLGDPARWPEVTSAGGRFTALRHTGLLGQTFEIDLCLSTVPRLPLFTRGYVTCTQAALAPGDEADRAVAALGERVGEALVAPGGRALAHVALTTHAGHPLGRAVSHLVCAQDAGGSATIRDVGEWDPLPRHLAAAYAAGGGAAQHAFWSSQGGDASMLVQLARVA